MSRLIIDKLHTYFLPEVSAQDPVITRHYTLTHSDYTGDLYLTVGPEYNSSQLSGTYANLLRDEVLGEWQKDDEFALHIYCHVSGGLVLGPAALRYKIFKKELPLALEAIRYGDRRFFVKHPYLDQAQILVHFNSSDPKYQKLESWGTPADYKLLRTSHQR